MLVTSILIPTTFMLRVTFSPAPECVVADCWNRAFRPPVAPEPLLLLFVNFIPALTKGKVGNAFTGRRLSLHNDILGLSTCYKNVIYDIGTKILFLE